jgi:hypothetical protein
MALEDREAIVARVEETYVLMGGHWLRRSQAEYSSTQSVPRCCGRSLRAFAG